MLPLRHSLQEMGSKKELEIELDPASFLGNSNAVLAYSEVSQIPEEEERTNWRNQVVTPPIMEETEPED